MSNSRPPTSADDPEDSPASEHAPAPEEPSSPHEESAKITKPEAKAEPDNDPVEVKSEAVDESSPSGSAAPHEEVNAETGEETTEPENKPDIDLEGVRAATVISMSGGPRSSRAKWAFINLGIKLFKLTARFFPAILMLGGLSYSYIHFFGAPPIMEKILTTPTIERITSNPTVDAVLNKVGIDLPTKEERAEAAKAAEASGEANQPTSRVGKMLQQTRDVVAASDARVNMGNALAEGSFEAMDDLLAEQDGGEEGTEGGAASTAAAAPGGSGDPLTAGAQAVALPELVSVSTYAGSNAVWSEFRNEAEAAAAAAAQGKIEEPDARLDTNPREVVYTSDVEPSPAFRAWLRSLQIGGVMTGPEPKALINNMTFAPGEMVDYNLRVTFEGLAEDDTLMVFKDATNAYLTIVH